MIKWLVALQFQRNITIEFGLPWQTKETEGCVIRWFFSLFQSQPRNPNTYTTSGSWRTGQMSSTGQWSPQSQIFLGEAVYPSSMNEYDSVGLATPFKGSALRMLDLLDKWINKNRYQLSSSAAFRCSAHLFFPFKQQCQDLSEATKFRLKGALEPSLARGCNWKSREGAAPWLSAPWGQNVYSWVIWTPGGEQAKRSPWREGSCLPRFRLLWQKSRSFWLKLLYLFITSHMNSGWRCFWKKSHLSIFLSIPSMGLTNSCYA